MNARSHRAAARAQSGDPRRNWPQVWRREAPANRPLPAGGAGPAGASRARCGRLAKRSRQPAAREVGRGARGRKAAAGRSVANPGGRCRGAAKTQRFPASGRSWRASMPREDRERTEFNQRELRRLRRFPRGRRRRLASRRPGPARRTGRRAATSCCIRRATQLVQPILPAGCLHARVSDKLNGTLRSPVLPGGQEAHQLSGDGAAEQRRAAGLEQLPAQLQELPGADVGRAWQWVTFSPPDERESLRTYAELMTMFDNPKFPDQLGALGGDKENYRLPWEKAAENPRSYFGVTRVVLHDGAEPPKAELIASAAAVRRQSRRQSLAELGRSLRATSSTAAVAPGPTARRPTTTSAGSTALLRRELLSNQRRRSPRLEELVSRVSRRSKRDLPLPRIVAGHRRRRAGLRAAGLRPRRLPDGPARPCRGAIWKCCRESGEPFASPRQRPAGTGRADRQRRQPAHGARDGQPRLASPVRHGPRPHGRRLRPRRRVAVASGVARLPGGAFVEDGWSIKRLIRGWS